MLNATQPKADVRLMNPATLAFVGDVVYELLVRERLVADGDRPVGQFHNQAVEQVRASAQAGAYHLLEPGLTGEELAVLKRGRNANTAHPPKSADAQDYRKATGVEALFGYLYLQGRMDRIGTLFERIWAQRQPDDQAR